jgi:hypothetical protein
VDHGPGGGEAGAAGPWVAPDTPVPTPEGPGAGPPTVGPGPRAVDAVGTAPGDGPRVPVPLRPMRLLDVLDGAFNVVKLRPRTVMGLTAVLVLPVQLLAAYASRGQLGSTFDLSANASIMGALDNSTTGWADIVFMYVALLPLPFVGAFIGRMVAGWYAGIDESPRELLRALAPRIPALLGAWTIIHLIETPAALACGVPVLFVFPLVLTVAPAIGVEDLGAVAGIKRGWRLGTRRYWACFWVASVSVMVSFVLGISFGLIPTLLADAVGGTWGWLLLALGTGLTELIVTPFVAAAAALAYLDARIRTEGLDLELRAVEVFGKAGS